VVDCGGDLWIGGVDGFECIVEFIDFFFGVFVVSFEFVCGVVVISGLCWCVWCYGDGFVYYLIDLGCGVFVWIGFV